MELITSTAAEHLLALSLRAAHKRREMLVPTIMGQLVGWCAIVTAELHQRDAAITKLPTVVKFPESRRKAPHAYLIEAGTAPHVSTADLRRHAFAAYAMAMAFHDAETAFDAAVYETLRRAGNWTMPAAVAHTKRFIVPAYDAAFPKAK